ncbi:MAG TPA: hypothetical protein ENN22_09075 [bacterium]|nr:hypothetical protein [bacterium]
MKETPQEHKIQKNFEPGEISKDGFLGKDNRHIHDIIEADERLLDRLGVTRKQLAERLQFFIDEGKKGLENEVELNHFTVKINWARGMMPCPFGEKRLHYKIYATVFNNNLNARLHYSQLNVHMIGEHGFFQGKGSKFRLEPEELVRILEI